jgi:hypothetical protein
MQPLDSELSVPRLGGEFVKERAGAILDFGFWILDFGFWILDFGWRGSSGFGDVFHTSPQRDS